MERPLIVRRLTEVLDHADRMVRAAIEQARVNAPGHPDHGLVMWPRMRVRGTEASRSDVLAYIIASSPERALEVVVAARTLVAIHEAPPAKGLMCGACREEFPCCTILAIALPILGEEELNDLLGGEVEAWRLAAVADAPRLPILDAVATIVEATTGVPPEAQT